MAYFLKQSKNNKGLYLQIYDSFYDPAKRQTAHKAIKPIGYVHELEVLGIRDPIAHYKDEIKEMNRQRKAEREKEDVRRIADETPERMVGHFAASAIDRRLGTRADLDYLQLASGFRFSLADLLSSLVYARLVAPCSKSKTFHDILPKLIGTGGFSLDQLYDGLAFLGDEYEKVVEIYNSHVAEVFGLDASKAYFDCTNFYFEIDREDDLRRKGPSKENRKDPIVALGLLLDADQIPCGMKVFAGNESEKPVLREVIGSLKRKSGVTGRTVRVADKGLNCADNVAAAILDKDGYIFSKSVRQLAAQELAWALDESGWQDVKDRRGNVSYRLKSCIAEFSYQVTGESGKKRPVGIEEKRVVTYNPTLARKQISETNRQVEKARKLRLAKAKKSEYGDSAKFVTFSAIDDNGCETDDKVVASLNHEAIDKARRLAGYNMIVTSELHMSDAEVYAAYHNLWRIEESFKVMKSQLDARPVYLQNRSSIVGHFLVCYIAVLLLRILQFKVLDKRFSTEEIMEMMRGLRVVEVSDGRYINITKSSSVLSELEKMTGLALSNFNLTKGQIKEIMEYKMPYPVKRQSNP